MKNLKYRNLNLIYLAPPGPVLPSELFEFYSIPESFTLRRPIGVVNKMSSAKSRLSKSPTGCPLKTAGMTDKENRYL
jgi:hypothetical protein